MQFLAPLFLVALAGLAIPVLLHLTQREKKQIVRFPSLMFVRRIPYQSVRRRKVQHWLLLLVRMTALALLIAAFARPFIMRTDAITPPGAGARPPTDRRTPCCSSCRASAPPTAGRSCSSRRGPRLRCARRPNATG